MGYNDGKPLGGTLTCTNMHKERKREREREREAQGDVTPLYLDYINALTIIKRTF